MGDIADIGRALVAARRVAGLTQAELAGRLGVKRQQVQRWESQAYSSTSLSRVGEVAAALGFDAIVMGSEIRLTHDRSLDGAPPADANPVRELGEAVARIRANGPALHSEYGVTKVGVFGSFVEARQTPESDVDVLVETADANQDTHQLERFLEEVLGRRVDVTIADRLRWEIRDDVLREVIRVWAA